MNWVYFHLFMDCWLCSSIICCLVIYPNIFILFLLYITSDSHLFIACVFQCQNQPNPPRPSRTPPKAQCPPASALLPPHPPVLVLPEFPHKFLLVVGTMQSSGLLWPTDSPPPHLEARPPNSSDTCPERFHQDFAASKTTKCY